jgi:TolB protein
MRTKRRWALLVALVGGIALVGSVAPAAATAPGRNGRIAFSYGGGDLESLEPGTGIYTIRADGTGLRKLTHTGRRHGAGAPAYAPDGSRIVYQSDVSGPVQIWMMDADGGNQHLLVDDPGYGDYLPTWSPDGDQVAFSRCDTSLGFPVACEIAVADADGSNLHNLTSGHWVSLNPTFSPDGNHIAFESDRGGLKGAVWVMNADGTGLHRVTRPNVEAFSPDWSPDGSRISFSDNCCRPHSNVWTMRPDGTDVEQVSDVPLGQDAAFASYSPDGGSFVLDVFADACCTGIYTMNVDGSGLTRIVADPTGGELFAVTSWQPKP